MVSSEAMFIPSLTMLKLMGLAVYNSIILDIRFPPCCYKKLLSPAVVPFHDPNATVGIAPLGLQDLMETMPVSLHYYNTCKPPRGGGYFLVIG